MGGKRINKTHFYQSFVLGSLSTKVMEANLLLLLDVAAAMRWSERTNSWSKRKDTDCHWLWANQHVPPHTHAHPASTYRVTRSYVSRSYNNKTAPNMRIVGPLQPVNQSSRGINMAKCESLNCAHYILSIPTCCFDFARWGWLPRQLRVLALAAAIGEIADAATAAAEAM